MCPHAQTVPARRVKTCTPSAFTEIALTPAKGTGSITFAVVTAELFPVLGSWFAPEIEAVEDKTDPDVAVTCKLITKLTEDPGAMVSKFELTTPFTTPLHPGVHDEKTTPGGSVTDILGFGA